MPLGMFYMDGTSSGKLAMKDFIQIPDQNSDLALFLEHITNRFIYQKCGVMYSVLN